MHRFMKPDTIVLVVCLVLLAVGSLTFRGLERTVLEDGTRYAPPTGLANLLICCVTALVVLAGLEAYYGHPKLAFIPILGFGFLLLVPFDRCLDQAEITADHFSFRQGLWFDTVRCEQAYTDLQEVHIGTKYRGRPGQLVAAVTCKGKAGEIATMLLQREMVNEPLGDMLRQARQHGVKLVFDPYTPPARWNLK